MKQVKSTIQEIQAEHSSLYNNDAEIFADIASHEDPGEKLRSFLLAKFNFDGKSILEAGAGSGRITAYYAHRARRVTLTDVSESMVALLKQRFRANSCVTAMVCDHRALNKQFHEIFDLFLCAFSLCYAYNAEVRDSDAFLEQILPAARHHIIIECCGMYEYLDHVVPEYYPFFGALERRFRKETILTEFVFSSPAQAYEAAGILVPPVAERVKRENRPVIPEMIGIYYD